MALKKNRLLEELDYLREQIREEERIRTGKNKTVCTDAVLKEIASKRPLKISDFLAIQGIGNIFMDNYASRFLRVIQKNQTESVKEVRVSRSAYKVLDHYKDRLSNISRRNPNLYMGKNSKKKSFDLALLNLEDEIIRFLTNKKVINLPLSFEDSYQGELQERHVTTLYRETNKDEKETGSYDLYIAYPYIEGVFKKDNFAIKAPLLYFPVKLVRNKRDFIIKKDKDKDIIYNRDLLLATSKMEKNDVDSNVPDIPDFSYRSLVDTVLPYYRKQGINIESKKLRLQFDHYQAEAKDQFVKRRKGTFELKEYITIGRYKLYSSMIQKDMSRILDSNRYNDLLEGLIDETNLNEPEKAAIFNIDNLKINENKISYINEVNYSQEKVIDLLNTEQKLVIWGPPGTGKSQTITSLIASSVLKGENVLVVSEKKVALDVIYSRLKEASKYTMFIDDSENKQDFYHKLNEFLNPILPTRTINNDMFSLEIEIKRIINDMDKSLTTLYGKDIQDVPVYKLFERYVKDRDVIKEMTPIQVHNMFINTYKKPDFEMLNRIEKTFDKQNHLKDYIEYEDIKSTYPILNRLETKISRSNKLEFESFTEDLKETKLKYDKAWFFGKRKIRQEFLERNKGRLLFLTVRNNIDKLSFRFY